MSFLLGLLGWAILVAGALPEPGRRWVEGKVPFWDERWGSLASGVLEAALGYFFLRFLLIQAGFENAMPNAALARGTVGAFMGVEGLIRVAIATQGSGSASLPLFALWRLVVALRSGAHRTTAPSAEGLAKRH
jgi:uncharacterized membrane protein HdeD (DUF308 family)